VRRGAAALLGALALTGCGETQDDATRADTTPEATDPVQETAAGEDVRARSVVIELEGEVTGSATLAPVGNGTRVTIRLGEGDTANGAAVLRGGCEAEAIQQLELEGNTFGGTIPQTLDELLDDDGAVAVEVLNQGERLACGASNAQIE